MKKLITTFTIIFLSLTLFSCKADDELAEIESIYFCEGLPTYQPSVEYEEVEVPEELKEYDAIKEYKESDGTIIILYRWSAENKTLSEIMKQDVATYYPDSKCECVELDNWATDGDYHYGYYMVYDKSYVDSPYFLQNYYFIVGDDVVELQFVEPAIRMYLPISGWTIDLPLGYEDGILDKEELDDDALAKFIPGESEEFPDINIYRWEIVYDTYEDFAEEELSELYDMKEYKVYSYKDIYDNEQTVLFSIYDEDDDGELQTNYDYTFNTGEYSIAFDFFVLKDDVYIRYAIPSIASTIAHQ